MEDDPIRQILLGIDRGDLAENALTAAMELAEAFDASLDVVHAVDIRPPLRGAAATERWAEASAKAISDARAVIEGRLDLTVEHPRFAELPVGDYLHVTTGRPAAVLIRYARDHGTDLVVLGAHRHRKVIDFGGTARAILAESPCPVWVQVEPVRKVRRILTAIDLSESAADVLALARLLARRFEARVDVMHVFAEPAFAYDDSTHEAAGVGYVIDAVRDEEKAEFERLFSTFPWGDVPVENLFVDGEASEEILTREKDYDLLVLGTHGRTGISRAVLGSEAYRVLKKAVRPIVVVPPPEQSFVLE